MSNNGDKVGVIALLPEIFCDGSFYEYIDINATDAITTSISEKMCNLTATTKQFDMTKLFLEEIDLDKYVHLVMNDQKIIYDFFFLKM